MSVPGGSNSLLLTSAAAGPSVAENYSLRFNSADSASLTRTVTTKGDTRKFTFSCWLKRGKLGAFPYNLFSGSTGTDQGAYLCFPDNASNALGTADTLVFKVDSAGSVGTQAVFRDPSAWYHVVLAVDTTQATDSNRVKIWVNGVLQTLTVTASPGWPTLNYELSINDVGKAAIGAELNDPYGTRFHGDFLLAEVHFLDGQVLTPSSFGATDVTTGVWNPITVTGVTYGTNGYYLDFSDNSSTTSGSNVGIGADSSGNGNYYDSNNISVTPGAGNDSLADYITDGTTTDTGYGGELSGNYCTWNPLRQRGSNTVSNGNLDVTLAAGSGNSITGTFAQSSGKWYWEVTHNGFSNSNALGVGIIDASVAQSTISLFGGGAVGYYLGNGSKYVDGASTGYGAAASTGAVIGAALDLDSGTKTITFYKDGVSQGAINLPSSFSVWSPALSNGTSGGTVSAIANFGQRTFEHSAPSGFKALCTANFDTSLITKGSTVFDVLTYSGNSGVQNVVGLNFEPDFVWIKSRSNTYGHRLIDQVRGATVKLATDSDAAEATESNGLTSFLSTGFTLNLDPRYNASPETYVAWNWDAGTSSAPNTDGSITSTVRANPSAGFSIVSWTGTLTASTVGHGLGAVPELIIVKNRDQVTEWGVYTKTTGNANTLFLNLDNSSTPASLYWNSTSPTSSVFSVGAHGATNGSGKKMVAYCFAPVKGYSAFGSHTGNGSADGTFVYTGFRPRWIMTKRTDSTAFWMILDSARDTYNVVDGQLYPNTAALESSSAVADFLSNGFKARSTSNEMNTNGGTYVWAAFAENPFKYARAR
jgi:hypothetical protein